MTTSGAVRWFTWKMTTRPVAHRGFREALGGIARRELHNAPDASKLLGLRPCPYVKYFHLICYTDRECGIKIGVVCIIWVAGGMFTIGFRGCDFHEKDACGSAALKIEAFCSSVSAAFPVLRHLLRRAFLMRFVRGSDPSSS